MVVVGSTTRNNRNGRGKIDELITSKVGWRSFHARSSPLCIAHVDLLQSLCRARRLDALEWLVQAFENENLSDTQLFNAFGLLDRYAALSPEPIAAGPAAFALVLAVLTLALKAVGTRDDLGRARKLVDSVWKSSKPKAKSPKPWHVISQTEIRILHRLGFNVCTPTARDLLDRLCTEPLLKRSWNATSYGKCTNLARFLLEVTLVYEPEAVYGAGHPPLAAALGAVFLALVAFDAPKECIKALQEPFEILVPAESAVVELAGAMRRRWVEEEKLVGAGLASTVKKKWNRILDQNGFGVSPPDTCKFVHLTSVIAEMRKNILCKNDEYNHNLEHAPNSFQELVSAATAPPSRRILRSNSKSAPMFEHTPSHVTKQENVQYFISPGGSKPAMNLLRLGSKTTRTTPRIENCRTPNIENCPTEPLVGILDVLKRMTSQSSCAASNPDTKLSASSISADKQKASSEIEALASSALRPHWPVTGERLRRADVSKACRDAAATLSEAARHLLEVATGFDGDCKKHELSLPVCPLKSKRRRMLEELSPMQLSSRHGAALRV